MRRGLLAAAGLLTLCGNGCLSEADHDEPTEDVEQQESALTTRTFVATADAYVDSAQPANNFGNAASLQVDTWPSTLRSYVRFDVPTLAGKVKRAAVRLYVTDPSPDGPKLATTTTNWSEGAITWNNAPAASTVLGDVGAVTKNTWIEYDVTSRVTGAGAYAFALLPDNADGADFAARTAANPPTLVVDLEDPPPSKVTLTASADAYVDSAQPANNFGNAASLQVDTWPSTLRSYVRFDVPTLAGKVKRAAVRLYVTDPSPDGPKLATTTTNWSEGAITWNNAPAASTVLGDVGAVTKNTWIEYDVTSRVTGAGAYAFALLPDNADGADFAARTAANPPTLVLDVDGGTTEPPPPPPPPPTRIACPSSFAREVFRDDFDGTAVDTQKWQIVDQGTGGGTFTQLTHMRRENARVADGVLRLASQRHCENPRTNRAAPEHPGQCAGSNFYSGAWLKAVNGYAAGKGLMVFRAKMPPPQPGTFPALWARNSEGGALYTEFDLIETWWDSPKGQPSDPNRFSVTTHFGSGAAFHAQGSPLGPFSNLVTQFHVWELEWDATVSPARGRYYYRDAPGATRVLLREVTHESSGFAGNVSADEFRQGLDRPFRPYMDFAVVPDNRWSVGPDTAATYDPEDLLVDSVIVCQP